MDLLAGRDDTMEFRILGPFEVAGHGQSLEVGAGKQRALLAFLLLHAGEVVSTDRLIDALWEEHPPASALNSVHVYVSQLRRAFGNGHLETRGHGYRLTLEPDQLDLGRFERLLGDGRALLAAGETERAAHALRAGLALWRGPPLSDFASEPFAQGEIARLEELRLAALEERIEADLALGRHAELVSELEALVREHPLRERLRAQLMLALYRSGRQAEALDSYQQARRMLAEDLGLEPGRTLQELERAILRQDAQLDPPGRASISLRPGRRGSGVLIAAGAVLLLSVAIAVAGIELTRGDGPGLGSASANSVAAIDAKSNRLVAEVPVGHGPTSLAVGVGSVWVTNALDRSVSRIDPRTGTVLQRIDVGGDPSGIAVGAGAVWVANSLDGTVMRIDPVTNRVVQTIPVGVTPNAIVFARGALWVTSADDRSLNDVDPLSGHVVKTIPTGALGRGIAVGAGSVWVTDEASGGVVRIDPEGGRVVNTVTVGNGPTGIAFGAGSVWVVNSLDGTVMRIDPQTNTVTATTAVGEGPKGIAADTDAVWVSSEFAHSVVRIDPATADVVERIPIGNRPEGLAGSENRVWAAVQPSGAGHRGGRLVVDVPGPGYSIDPSFWNWAGTIAALSTVYDGLVGAARRGGSEGTQIVPDLATSLPVVTAGETRYAFQLRGGIRYSDGRLVKASDFRRAFERPFRAGSWATQPFPSIVGVDACKRAPRRCDLSDGVRTDDATGTIVFQLRRPDPDFLANLVGWAPIPPDTPNRDLGTRPVPSTGPYKTESYDPKRAQILVRNPYFRVWSRIATPDGFPDEIVFRFLVGARAGVAAVERGRADVAYLTPAVTRRDELEARYASRVHLHPEQATVFVFLNTTLPPFDDVRVRRALNLAIDRAAVARTLGGPELARVTCQLRPPGTVGFQRYCPYTAAPDRTGEWKARDLARARRLVAASGSRGMKVDVWTYPGFWVPGAQGAVSALKRLGYRARLRLARTSDEFFARTGDRSARGLQAGMMGLYGIPRTPDSVLTTLRCSSIRPGTLNPNLGFLCDRRMDARLARALELRVTDPDAAVGPWARIEKQLVDLAPWVPLVTPWSGDLVSERVGNYQYNPTERILFDQLWVR